MSVVIRRVASIVALVLAAWAAHAAMAGRSWVKDPLPGA